MERPFEGRLQVPQQVPKDMESEADELYVKEGRHPGVGGKEGWWLSKASTGRTLDVESGYLLRRNENGDGGTAGA